MLQHVKGTVYDGKSLDTLEARYEGLDNTRYSVFRYPKTGKRSCVVVNLGEGTRAATVGAFDGNDSGEVRIYAPFERTRTERLPTKIEIPSERFAIVAEE